ncbi:MAG: Rab family GTPase [Candidatus Heimdallarchaeaceae archaeon]
MLTQNTIKKILIIGDGAVGKTTLVYRLLNKSCEHVSITPGLNIESYTAKISDTEIDIVIYDLGGQPQFRFFQIDFTQLTHAILLVFDVSRYESFLNLQNEWMEFLTQSNLLDKPCIIIANKIDLQNVVPESDIEEFAAEINARYISVSALNNINIPELKELIIKELITDD